MDDPDSGLMTAKYYEPCEISILPSGISTNRPLFHLNQSLALISWVFLKPLLN